MEKYAVERDGEHDDEHQWQVAVAEKRECSPDFCGTENGVEITAFVQDVEETLRQIGLLWVGQGHELGEHVDAVEEKNNAQQIAGDGGKVSHVVEIKFVLRKQQLIAQLFLQKKSNTEVLNRPLEQLRESGFFGFTEISGHVV